MQERISQWLSKYFATEEAVVLFFLLLGAVLTFWLLGAILAPVVAALIIAFVMDGAVGFLHDKKVPRRVSVWAVYTTFLAVLGSVIILLLPLAWRQLASLFNYQLPQLLSEGRDVVLMLPEHYPDVVSESQALDLVEYASNELAQVGQVVLSFSLSNIPNVMVIAVYLILVPLLVFFFLNDKDKLTNWGLEFLPENRPKITAIWQEMNGQITNYIRGKFIEIGIIGMMSYLAFAFFDLNYAALLGLLVGLSVIVPYVGAVSVTVPVMIVAYLQYGYGGWGSEFVSIMLTYLAIQIFDGNILVPFLFSEAVNLHPVSIIVAILVFGGLWGFWGIFFAIPLATLVKALYNSWPKRGKAEFETEAV